MSTPAADSPQNSAGTARRPLRDRSAFVLGIAILSAALTGPGQTIGVSVFIDHFVEDLSLTRSQVSGAYLVGTLVGASFLPMVGRFIDRRGVRRSQIIVGLFFALALVNMSRVNGLLWLAIGFTGIRFLGQGSLSLVSTVTVSLRFRENRGTALGIFSTASGALMILTPVGMAFLISQYGWRSTWLVAAGVIAATVVPLAWFGLRDMPVGRDREVIAVEPRAGDATIGDADEHGRSGDFDRAEAMHTRSFWMLAAVTGAASMLGTALNFHQIDLLGEAGFSETAAAALFIPQVFGSTLGGLAVGYLSDRVGTRYIPAAGMVLLIAAHWLAAIVAPGVVVLVYTIVLGAMGATVRTVSATLLPAWFGTTNLGSIQGSLTFFNVGASALGPVALAVVQSGYGSYPPAVMTLSVIPMVALLFSLVPDHGRRSISVSSSRDGEGALL